MKPEATTFWNVGARRINLQSSGSFEITGAGGQLQSCWIGLVEKPVDNADNADKPLKYRVIG